MPPMSAVGISGLQDGEDVKNTINKTIGEKMAFNIDIKEIIMNALKEQREALLSEVCSVSIYDADDYRDYVESEVFSENDILEKALESIGLDVSDIDPNDFRDFQNETIELCLEKFKQNLTSKNAEVFDNCYSLEDVIQVINDEFGTELTAEQVAAQYARDAVIEAGYEISKQNIEAHLDVLFENGAKFDYEEALKIALNQ